MSMCFFFSLRIFNNVLKNSSSCLNCWCCCHINVTAIASFGKTFCFQSFASIFLRPEIFYRVEALPFNPCTWHQNAFDTITENCVNVYSKTNKQKNYLGQSRYVINSSSHCIKSKYYQYSKLVCFQTQRIALIANSFDVYNHIFLALVALFNHVQNPCGNLLIFRECRTIKQSSV